MSNIRVLKFDEKPQKDDPNYYGHQWEVRFSKKNKETGFWEPWIQAYKTVSKNRHRQVEAQWKRDYSNEEVRLIGIDYL